MAFLSSYLHLCLRIICSRVINHFYTSAPLLEIEFQKMRDLESLWIHQAVFVRRSLSLQKAKEKWPYYVDPTWLSTQFKLDWPFTQTMYIIQSPNHVWVQSYITQVSTLNFDLILWHTQLIMSKMLNHGWNHGLFISLFKLIPCPMHWIIYVLAYLNFIF